MPKSKNIHKRGKTKKPQRNQSEESPPDATNPIKDATGNNKALSLQGKESRVFEPNSGGITFPLQRSVSLKPPTKTRQCRPCDCRQRMDLRDCMKNYRSTMAQKVYISEAESDIVQEAFRFFDSGDFHDAAQYFSGLFEMWPEKLHYDFNRIVAELRNKGGMDVSALFQQLLSVASKLGKTSVAVEQQSYSQDPVMAYNTALTFLFYGKHKNTLHIVEEIEKTDAETVFLEPLSENIVLLHINALLKAQEFDKTLALIQEIETQNDNLKTLSPKPTLDFPIQVQQYKTQCFLSMRSLRNAKRECKLLFSLTGTNHPSIHIGACLKANHDYLRGNLKKAAKTMSTFFQEGINIIKTENSTNEKNFRLSMIFKNNEACCEFKLLRPNVATTYYTMALTAYDEAQQDHCLPLFEAHKKVAYNFAISLLHVDPVKAFPKLCCCVRHYPNNPRLLLRVAEACINIHKPCNKWHRNLSPENENYIAEYVQTSGTKRLIFPRCSPKVRNRGINVDGPPEPTLEYAQLCLQNALILMSEGMKTGQISVLPSNPITEPREITNLQASIICSLAFVALEIENYPLAIKSCTELLEMQLIPTGYTYLAKLYLGRAHHLMGEHVSSLSALFCSNINCDLSFKPVVSFDDIYQESEGNYTASNINQQLTSQIYRAREWYPNNKLYAQALLAYHQISTLVDYEEYQRALEIFMSWSSKFGTDPPLEFLMHGVNIHLKMGNIDLAVHLLRQHWLIRSNTLKNIHTDHDDGVLLG